MKALMLQEYKQLEIIDMPETQAFHLQDDRGQVGALDLGLGELRAAREILGAEQPDAGSGTQPAATSMPLL